MKLQTVIGVVALFIFAYLVLGFILVMPAKNQLDANTGQVWNALSTGAEKINALQNQVQAPTDMVREVMNNLAASRNDILAAQQTGDLIGALKAYDTATVQLNALTEAYPELIDLGPLYATLMDETSGAFNRVKYRRDELIAAQANFNTTCTFFFLACSAQGGTVEVLGSTSNTAAPMQLTPMGS